MALLNIAGNSRQNGIHKNAVSNSYEALLKSCKKIENLEKNTEIPEIIREYVTLTTSTDNLAL